MQIFDFDLDGKLQELTDHRTIELPVACYETTISKNVNGYIPLHWHEEVQFVLITEGEGVFQVNEEKIEIKEGEGLFINSGRLHMAEEQAPSTCVYICLNVSPHFLAPQELYPAYVYPFVRQANVPYIFIGKGSEWGRDLLKAIRDVHHVIESEAFHYELETSLLINQIWKALIDHALKPDAAEGESVTQRRMKKMLSFIHQHYSEKISLDAIAKAGQLSRSECCRYFKKVLKKTPLTYVTDYRIQQSIHLLQHPDSNVTEVGYQVGFNSSSYFISKFRDRMLKTPLAYKKAVLQEE